MTYLIDTNICIYIMNKRPAAVVEKLKTIEYGRVMVSAITVSELQYGVAKSNRHKKNRQRLSEFLMPFQVLDYDEKAAAVYGEIRFQLEKTGQPIGPLDMLIAAQALSRKLILVTNNDREFHRIKNIRIENWADD